MEVVISPLVPDSDFAINALEKPHEIAVKLFGSAGHNLKM